MDTSLHLFMWPLLAVWMGIALLILAGIIATAVWTAGHMVWDGVVGAEGDVACPVLHRSFHVRGTPRHFLGVPFSKLSRCERWEDGHIRCKQPCLLAKGARAETA